MASREHKNFNGILHKQTLRLQYGIGWKLRNMAKNKGKELKSNLVKIPDAPPKSGRKGAMAIYFGNTKDSKGKSRR